MPNYMDETGFTYSTSAKANTHPTYVPHTYSAVDETGTKYESQGMPPVPYYLDSVSGSVSSAVQNLLNSSGGSGSGGSGSGSGSGSDSPFVVKDGKVQFADPNLQYAMMMINQQSQANNEWSAEQAQKQMDFQKEMSDTAHQREVADLQAAGLNPVLSAGGNGAQVTSGAMGQTDDSNTRLIGDLAMAAIDAVSNTAVGVAGSVGKRSQSGLLNNYYVKRLLGSAASGLGWQVARGIAKAVV